MSDFAFFRFRTNNMLTKEEEEHKDEIIRLTEEVLQAKGIQCDATIAKIPEGQLKEILYRKSDNSVKRRKHQAQKLLKRRHHISNR